VAGFTSQGFVTDVILTSLPTFNILQVDVGDLLRLKSCVLHTENEDPDHQLMHIEVTAHVTQPELRTSEVHNS
jgi:hypothetical protein